MQFELITTNAEGVG